MAAQTRVALASAAPLVACLALGALLLATSGWHGGGSGALWGASAAGEAAGGVFQLDARGIATLACAFVVASLAASAGVGGGAFFVPLYMLALGLSLKEATVLSQASIAAVSAASIAFNLSKRHPADPGRTLVDFPFCLTMTPALLLGVSIGVVFNAALPTWLITSLLVCMLVFMSTRTAQKGLQQWRGETRRHRAAAEAAAAAAAAAAAEGADPPTAAGSSGAAAGTGAGDGSGAVVVIGEGAAEGDDGKARPARQPYPWGQLAAVVALWVGFSALQVLRGQTARCSPAFWAVSAGQVLFGAGCSLAAAYVCIAAPARRRAQQLAGDLGAPLLDGSSASAAIDARAAHQQESMAVLAAATAKVALAGVAAGILGIGGGMLLAPFLLDSGIHPLSAAATSNILVFIASSSATLAFALDGRGDLNVEAAYAAVCCVGCVAGLSLFSRLVQRSGRPSIIVLLLAGIMGCGALCSGVFGFWDAWEQAKRGGGSGFATIC